MTSNALLASCQSDLFSLRENDAEKETVFSQGTGIFKGSDEHFTVLLFLVALPLNSM